MLKYSLFVSSCEVENEEHTKLDTPSTAAEMSAASSSGDLDRLSLTASHDTVRQPHTAPSTE